MKKIDIRDIRSEEILAVNRGENTLFQRRENLSKHTSYARERMQYDAIRSGQVEQILSLLQQKPDGTEGILSKDQLRNSKNMFIAGITLFTRAAIDGGVPEETAYSLPWIVCFLCKTCCRPLGQLFYGNAVCTFFYCLNISIA